MKTSLITGANGPLLEPLAFPISEYERRLAGVRAKMRELGVTTLLSWTPENILYLTGHDTPGYYYYQCCIVSDTVDPVMVVREIEATNTWSRSAYRQAAPYADTDDPVVRTLGVLAELGLLDSDVGVETDAWFISPRRFLEIQAGIERAGGRVVDASMMIEGLRLIKSDYEIAYIRRAARAADDAMTAAIEATAAGATENDVAAAVWASLMDSGSQIAGLPPFIASAERTYMCHATWSGRVLQRGDVLLYELPGVFERYVGPLVRSGVIGRPSLDMRRRAEANTAVTQAMIDAIHPGVTASTVQAVCTDAFRHHGFPGAHGHRAGYSIGVNYAPDWGEGHIMSIVETEERPFAENMTFHLIPGMTVAPEYKIMFSESILVTSVGCERLTHHPRELFTR